MRITVAIDSFKGSLSNFQAGAAITEGVRCVYPQVFCLIRAMKNA